MNQITTMPAKSHTPREQRIWNILGVDDESSVLSTLKRLLKSASYQFFSASSAKEGLLLMQHNHIDIVISDMRMPEMSGAEFLAEVAQKYAHTVRILLTGYSDMDSTVSAVNEGQIHRYIQKPWNNHELLLTLDQAIDRLCLEQEKQQLLNKVKQQNKALNDLNKGLEEKIQLRTRQIRQAMTKLEHANARVKDNHRATLKVFYNLISQNENLGGKSAIQVSDLCELIANKMDLDPREIRSIHLAGLLSELGLLGAPEQLLTPSYSELNPEQQKLYRSHPIKAYLALAPANSLEDVAEIIKHQYEQINGSGKPDGLYAEQIPVGSRILAIARDYIHSINGKLHNARCSSNGAIELLSMNTDRVYDSKILSLLSEAVPQLEHNSLNKNERLISIEQLEAGMELSRNLFNKKDILLLPEGYRFTPRTLQRLRAFENTDQHLLKIYVFEQ